MSEQGTMAAASATADARSAVLGTAEQIAAEKLLLAVLEDPRIAKAQGALRTELSGLERARSAAGTATLERAIAMWTRSLAFGRIVAAQPQPAILWSTDDTPRTWFGHTVGGLGVCGDNPDAIYRSAGLHANARYEVSGRLDPADRPRQWVMEHTRGFSGEPPKPGLSANQADQAIQLAMLTDLDLDLSETGQFRFVIDTKEPGALLFRDMLTDWRQKPSTLSLRRLDGGADGVIDIGTIRAGLLERLDAYIRYWATYPDSYLGGIAPNTIATPVSRDSGWGFIVGARFRLAPDEAIVVVTRAAGCAYTGSQICDLWMMTADVREYHNSLGMAQVTPDAGGAVTYVISQSDPGVANWLQTADSAEGFALFRWQGCPPGTTHDNLLLGFRHVKCSEVSGLEGVAWITPEQRRVRLAARRTDFNARLR